jgi:hypothetical protein
MSRFSQPPSYEQVANADQIPEERSSLCSDSTKVQRNEDEGKVDFKDDSVLIDVKEPTSDQKGRWRCLPTGDGWLWEILAMYVSCESKFGTNC